jgi:23S rRNA (uridine2552-2'-O)-methyltransferase
MPYFAKGRNKPKSGDPRWDHYAQRAKDEGYASRAVYKLEEIDRRFRIFAPGRRVLDLGCAPGGWLKFAAERVGDRGAVIGIDRFEVAPPKTNVRTFAADLTAPFDPGETFAPFDVVLSDMAPDTTGVRHVDKDRSAELTRIALDWALRLGKPGSAFIAKMFQGPDFHAILAAVKQAYGAVRCVRPDATRRESFEIYIVGQKKRHGPATPGDESRP